MTRYHYDVSMRTGDGDIWYTRVPLRWPRYLLPLGDIELRARNIAVQAFGPQAAEWTLLDVERKKTMRSKKITHVVKVHDGDARPFDGSGVGVYGEADLKRIKAEAKKAGVRITVSEVSPS